MKHITSICITVAAGLVLAACAGDPTIDREASVTLEPMAKPASLPSEIVWSGKGAGTYRLVDSQDGKITWTRTAENGEECSWSDDGWFSPTWEWEGCGGDGGNGKQVASKKGDIWPLQVGSKEVYEVEGKDEKYTWETTRTCEVKDAVMVAIAERQMVAYEVVCADKFSVRTWYVSPELQRVVRYKRNHRKRGLETDISAAL